MAILLVQDCSERLFFGRWVRVVYVRRQWGVREIALWLWAILLANVEHHFVFVFAVSVEGLVIFQEGCHLILASFGVESC